MSDFFNSLAEGLAGRVTVAQIQSLGRWVINAVGGVLVGHGIATAATVQTFTPSILDVLGAIFSLISLFLSWRAHRPSALGKHLAKVKEID